MCSEDAAYRPLAEHLRPLSIEDVFGQDHLLSGDGPLGIMIKSGRLSSLILWGPPGTGKTTIARLLAKRGNYRFVSISAVFSGIGDLKTLFVEAREKALDGITTLLFVDEIHRFNRAQQDVLLPVIEDGTILLLGATTENPSFELNGALLSRCQVLLLRRLGENTLEMILSRAEEKMGCRLPLTPRAREALCAMADGDGRYLLNMVEVIINADLSITLDRDDLCKILEKRSPIYDKKQENHYNLVSALHKSLRGSDADAALYWFARMLIGGEDPNFIARRLVRFSTEDIGLADPQALQLSLAAWDAYQRLGSPEGELMLVEAVLYLASAPKSNSVYKAFTSVNQLVKRTGSLSPPKHILNAPTELLKNIGYGHGYVYDHDTKEGFSGHSYMPNSLSGQTFYEPADRGFEREIRKRIEYWRRVRLRQTK
jgi:putative ATPase